MLLALRGYNTHLNEQKLPSQHMSRNHCLLRYGRVNIWVGILSGEPLEPVILPNRRTRAVCPHFLVNYLQALLENMFLHQRQGVFMHDEAPPHFLPTVRKHMNQTFGKQWIGRGGPVSRPSRSSDLNPLEFWLWRHRLWCILLRSVTYRYNNE
jgi:hypothetical protein